LQQSCSLLRMMDFEVDSPAQEDTSFPLRIGRYRSRGR
jgi:hypothetical protein